MGGNFPFSLQDRLTNTNGVTLNPPDREKRGLVALSPTRRSDPLSHTHAHAHTLVHAHVLTYTHTQSERLTDTHSLTHIHSLKDRSIFSLAAERFVEQREMTRRGRGEAL